MLVIGLSIILERKKSIAFFPYSYEYALIRILGELRGNAVDFFLNNTQSNNKHPNMRQCVIKVG